MTCEGALEGRPLPRRPRPLRIREADRRSSSGTEAAAARSRRFANRCLWDKMNSRGRPPLRFRGGRGSLHPQRQLGNCDDSGMDAPLRRSEVGPPATWKVRLSLWSWWSDDCRRPEVARPSLSEW